MPGSEIVTTQPESPSRLNRHSDIPSRLTGISGGVAITSTAAIVSLYPPRPAGAVTATSNADTARGEISHAA